MLLAVTFTARSPISNDTATCQFKIHVVGNLSVHCPCRKHI